MTAVERYELYEQSARETIPSATLRSLRRSAAGGAVIGAGIGVAFAISPDSTSISPVLIAIFAALGLIAGLVTNVEGIRWARRMRAESSYANRWAEVHGFVSHRGGVCPPNTPFRKSGDKPEPSDLFEGQVDGIDTTFYNFTYVVEKGDRLGMIHDPVRHRFRVMRLIGPTLPVTHFSLLKKGSAHEIEWHGELKDKHGPERPVSLESSEFNRRFSLSVDASADDIGIRQIFSPAAIQALVTRPFPFPCLLYYDGMWWTVEKDNYKIRDLDDWLPKQQAAIEAVKSLSRVKTL